MIIDGIEGLTDGIHPVCVIGSGPVGLAFATALTARGIAVLVLESGGKAADPAMQALAKGSRVAPEVHDDLMIATARRLGGTSNLWGGRALPYDAIDFAARDWVDARWPIAHDDLMRWIPAAVTALRAGGADFRGADPLVAEDGGLFDTDHLERWVNVQASQRIHARAIERDALLHIRLHATATGFDFAENGTVTGVRVADSRSGAITTVRVQHVVLAGGGLESARLLLNAQVHAPQRFGGSDGPLGRYYMGHLTGEIADLALANDGLARRFEFRVDHHGAYVRRRFTTSDQAQVAHRLLNTAMWPVVPPIHDARHGSAFLSAVYLALAVGPIGRRLTAEVIRRRHVPDHGVPTLPHLRNLALGAPAAIANLSAFVWRRYFTRARLPGFYEANRHHRFGLSYHAEHAPNADSRVTLTGTPDRLGLHPLRIDLRFADQDFASLQTTHDLFAGWVEATGIGRVEYRMPPAERLDHLRAITSHGTHQIGLTRMADTRIAGVVDAHLATFGAPNLHLATSAVLPTSGQANPTLSTVALALRLADRIAAQL